ncbi:MAG TPA: hypothetical protein VL769_01520 [Acidimicrobiia bacterium]|nr:hypothetical protein [Acidimicrobiia bacterium]
MRSLAAAGAGFLLCVLWFDLMFDVQARGHPRDVPADVRSSIAAYYARVTTAARPMNLLVALAMVVTIGATVGELLRGELPAWRAGPALLLTLGAVGLAAGRTVANARRLGRQSDDAEGQSRLARLILRDHLACIGMIAAALVLQLAPA